MSRPVCKERAHDIVTDGRCCLTSCFADPDKFNGFLLLGYGVMWLIVMIYIASLALRQRNLRRDIELMEQILQEDDEVGI